MSKFVDLTGLKFNYLTVIKRDGSYDLPNGKHIPKWLCKCDCGNFIHTRSYCLTSNHTKSCGCFQKEMEIMNQLIANGQQKWNKQIIEEIM